MNVFAAIAIILWALGYVMTRVALQHFTVEAIAFLRYMIAAIFLSLYAVIRKMSLPKLKDIPLFFVGGAVGFAVYVYAINVGSKTLMASVVSFIVSVSPIATALLARAFLRERIGVIGWISVVFAFSGVGVITYFNGGFSFTSGTVWICLAMLLVSIYNIYQRKLLLRYSPLEITAYCIVAGAILLSVFAPQSFPQVIGAAPVGIAAIVVLGVFSADVAYLCWAYALSKADKTTEVTNYMFVTPILTTFLGFILIGEVPHFTAYIGGAMVLAGVFLMNRYGARKA
jgi:drug/metabolite transporter (DMT)-like permease